MVEPHEANELKSQCERYLFDGEISSACGPTIDLLLRATGWQEFTLPTVVKEAGLDLNLSDAFKLMQFLSTKPVSLVELRYRLVIGDERIPLQIEELSEAYRRGVLSHPHHGEPVDNFESYVVPYFVPSRRLQSLLSD